MLKCWKPPFVPHRFGSLLAIVTVLVVSVATTASALASTATDPTDAPSGPVGKTDLRLLTWDVGATMTTLTASVDESTYGTGQRAELGVHVMVDTDRDGLADVEITGERSSDSLSVDATLRSLTGIGSTLECQDLNGTTVTGPVTVSTTITNGLEKFAFTFATSEISSGVTHFRWVAFGQSPEDAAQAGPWDYLPDAANPDPDTQNPGDRRCGPSNEGLDIDMSAGTDYNADSCPGYESDSRNQVVGTAGGDTLVGTSADDILCGLGGTDTVRGLGGNDVVNGGRGSDFMSGGVGKDTLDYSDSSAGVTVTFSGTVDGNGYLTASGGHAAGDKHKGFEHLTGSSFGDFVIGDGGRNIISGASGDDYLAGNAGDDDLFGGAGEDLLDGRAGADLCIGGKGGDAIIHCETGNP